MYAFKDIAPGKEILFDYGDVYTLKHIEEFNERMRLLQI